MREPKRPVRDVSAVIKRSVLIAGHPTSISLEAAFWDGLKDIAAERGLTITSLVTAIDSARTVENLSSAIRVFVLNRYRGDIGASGSEPQGTGERNAGGLSPESGGIPVPGSAAWPRNGGH